MQKENETLLIISTSKATTNSNTTNSSSLLYLNLSSSSRTNKSISSTTTSSSFNSTTCPKLNQGITALSPISNCSNISNKNNNDCYYLSLSSTSNSTCIYLCSTLTNNILWKSYIHDYPITSLLTLPHYNYIIGGDSNGKLHIWNSVSGAKYNKSLLQVHNRRITSMDCTVDGDFIVTGSEDGMVHLLGVQDLFGNNGGGAVEPRYTWCEHTLSISQVLCCCGSSYMAVSVGKDALVVLMELFSGSTLARILLPCPLTSVQVDATCDVMYVGTKSGKIYTIHISTYSASQQSNAKIIEHPATTTNSNNDATQDDKNKQEEAISELPQGHDFEITCLNLLKKNNNNTHLLISGDKNGFIRLWDTKELCTIRVFQAWGSSNYRISNILEMPITNQTSSITAPPPPPFQRFAKEGDEDDTLILLPTTSKTNKKRKNNQEDHKRILMKQCVEFYTGETPNNQIENATTTTSDVDKLQEELNEAKSTIQRWEDVNSKLMSKLNMLMEKKGKK